jgi:hypothetical protein
VELRRLGRDRVLSVNDPVGAVSLELGLGLLGMKPTMFFVVFKV